MQVSIDLIIGSKKLLNSSFDVAEFCRWFGSVADAIILSLSASLISGAANPSPSSSASLYGECALFDKGRFITCTARSHDGSPAWASSYHWTFKAFANRSRVSRLGLRFPVSYWASVPLFIPIFWASSSCVKPWAFLSCVFFPRLSCTAPLIASISHSCFVYNVYFTILFVYYWLRLLCVL